MTITLEIRPELKYELTRRATAKGQAPETYAAILLEEATYPTSDFTHQAHPAHTSLIEVCAMVQGLADDVDFSRNPSHDRPVDLS